jgi:hypothetical protein
MRLFLCSSHHLGGYDFVSILIKNMLELLEVFEYLVVSEDFSVDIFVDVKTEWPDLSWLISSQCFLFLLLCLFKGRLLLSKGGWSSLHSSRTHCLLLLLSWLVDCLKFNHPPCFVQESLNFAALKIGWIEVFWVIVRLIILVIVTEWCVSKGSLAESLLSLVSRVCFHKCVISYWFLWEAHGGLVLVDTWQHPFILWSICLTFGCFLFISSTSKWIKHRLHILLSLV